MSALVGVTDDKAEDSTTTGPSNKSGPRRLGPREDAVESDIFELSSGCSYRYNRHRLEFFRVISHFRYLMQVFEKRNMPAVAQEVIDMILADLEGRLGANHPDYVAFLNFPHISAENNSSIKFRLDQIILQSSSPDNLLLTCQYALAFAGKLFKVCNMKRESAPFIHSSLAIKARRLGADDKLAAWSLESSALENMMASKPEKAYQFYMEAISVYSLFLGKKDNIVSMMLFNLRTSQMIPITVTFAKLKRSLRNCFNRFKRVPKPNGGELNSSSFIIEEIKKVDRKLNQFSQSISSLDGKLTKIEKAIKSGTSNNRMPIGVYQESETELTYNPYGFNDCEFFFENFEAYSLGKDIDGADSPDRAIILHSLVIKYAKGGKLNEAICLCEQIIDDLERSVGRENAHFALVLNILCNLLLRCCNHDDKLLERVYESLNQSLGIMSRVLGPKCKRVAIIKSDISIVLCKLNHVEEALKFIRDARRGRAKSTNVDMSEDEAKQMSNEAMIMGKAGKLEEALTLLVEAIEMIKPIKSENVDTLTKIQTNFILMEHRLREREEQSGPAQI